MNARFKAFRWTVVLTILVTLCMIGVGLVSMQSQLDNLSATKRAGPMWIANQMEFELLRFTQALARFTSATEPASVDDVQFRFDILWSRHAVAAEGQSGHPAASGSDAASVLANLGQELHRQEGTVESLRAGDVATATRLFDIFSQYLDRAHEYTLAAKDEQAEADLKARTNLLFMSQLMVYLSLAMGIASLLLAVLFFVESRFHEKMSAENADLLEKAKSAYKAKSQFISTISHELRTPVTSIKGTLGLMRGGLLGEMGPKMARMVDIAHDNSDRLAALINDILDFEKSEAGELAYTFLPIDMAKVVRDSVESNRGFEARQGVTLALVEDGSPIPIEGDSFRLVQLVSNLLSNALKFSPKGQVVEVIVSRHGDNGRLQVRDHGMGIPDDFKAMVFDRFTQADSSNTRKVGGTGLGMSISKSIVERHGGRIWFESQVGVGTTFTVELPLAEEKTEAAEAAVEEPERIPA